jgi:hypothetical protein
MTGSDGSLRTVIGLGLAIAVLLGVAAAGGSMLRGTQTDATAGDAFPYALMGAVVAVAIVGTVLLALRLTRPGVVRLRPLELLAIAFIAAAIGALIGTAFTPDPKNADDVSPLDDEAIEQREQQSDTFEEGTRAGTVDRDGDGRPDTDSNGDLIIAYDTDGDGRIDGYLQPCPDSTPVPAPRPGFTPIDNDCDGTIDEWLPFDPDTILRGGSDFSELDPPSTIAPEEREQRADDANREAQGHALRNILLLALAVAVCAAIIVWLVRMPDRHDDGGATEDDPLPPPPAVDLSSSFEASLDTMLEDPDPREAICAAYGRLLDGFAEAGLPRRAEEAPEEHVRRCLDAAHMDPRPVRELLDLFALARFSSHPVDESHRLAAVRAMRASLASSGTASAVVAPAARPEPAGVGAPWGPPPRDLT